MLTAINSIDIISNERDLMNKKWHGTVVSIWQF